MKDVSYTVILYSYYSICNNIHVRCQLFFFDMPYIPDPCTSTMYSNFGTDSKSEMGFPRFNSSVHKKLKNIIFGWLRKIKMTSSVNTIQRDHFRTYSTLSKKVSNFPVPSRDVTNQTLPAGNN